MRLVTRLSAMPYRMNHRQGKGSGQPTMNRSKQGVPVGARRRYKKKPTAFVTAVQLDLDTEGFTYNKWGGKQVCKRGDWLVDKQRWQVHRLPRIVCQDLSTHQPRRLSEDGARMGRGGRKCRESEDARRR